MHVYTFPKIIPLKLSGPDSGLSSPLANAMSNSGPAAGLAWMSMDVSGLLTYRMMLTNFKSNVTSMQINNGKRSKRLLRVVHDIMADGARGHTNDLNPVTQWSNGSLRMEAADVEALYRYTLMTN